MKRRWSRLISALACLLFAPLVLCAQHFEDFTTPQPMPPDSYLVIGILGGIEHWNSEARPVNELAADLSAQSLPNVYVETLEHRHVKLARRLVIAALDTNHDGKLDDSERAHAHIILYGHSMGAAAVVKLARELHELGVPVRLTIQVDSVGTGDRDIPANVVRAANFYQRNGLFLRGESNIRAEDPKATTIIGNFKFDYKAKKVDLSGVNRAERVFGGAHTKMEFDKNVWDAVEALILTEIGSRETPAPPQP